MRDMLAHAREACSLIEGRSEDELHTDRLLQLEITRLVEIVGEAANRVSPEGWRRWPEIPWREAITTRNRIVHQYDQTMREFLDEWVRAVNQHGGFGRWAWAVSRTPSDVSDLLKLPGDLGSSTAGRSSSRA